MTRRSSWVLTRWRWMTWVDRGRCAPGKPLVAEGSAEAADRFVLFPPFQTCSCFIGWMMMNDGFFFVFALLFYGYAALMLFVFVLCSWDWMVGEVFVGRGVLCFIANTTSGLSVKFGSFKDIFRSIHSTVEKWDGEVLTVTWDLRHCSKVEHCSLAGHRSSEDLVFPKIFTK